MMFYIIVGIILLSVLGCLFYMSYIYERHPDDNDTEDK